MAPFFMRCSSLNYIAREFADRFPDARRFGLAWLEAELGTVMEEGDWTEGELLSRVRQYQRYRVTLLPRDLLRPLPQAPPPARRVPPPPLPVVPPADPKWLRRVMSFREPWEDEPEW